eukprot:2525456-Pleurochrysis_carterae.AAC.2
MQTNAHNQGRRSLVRATLDGRGVVARLCSDAPCHENGQVEIKVSGSAVACGQCVGLICLVSDLTCQKRARAIGRVAARAREFAAVRMQARVNSRVRIASEHVRAQASGPVRERAFVSACGDV